MYAFVLCVYRHTERDADAWIELSTSQEHQGVTLYVSLLQDTRRELGISIICEEKVQL